MMPGITRADGGAADNMAVMLAMDALGADATCRNRHNPV